MPASSASRNTAFVILGNQLFPFVHVKPYRDARFFMAEDLGLCTYVKHHKQKIALFLAAMRSHADELRKQGVDVHYERFEEQKGNEVQTKYETKLARFLDAQADSQKPAIERLVMFEIEDKFFEKRMLDFAEQRGLEVEFLASPMFLTPREAFAAFLDEHKPFMATFYEKQRKSLGVLLNKDGSPVGGKWSLDEENRKSLPKSVTPPGISYPAPDQHVADVRRIVEERFADHPGELDEWWLPTTRRQALAWYRKFLDERFQLFGDYEDALSSRDPFLYHGVLSPMLNLGLLTPREVLDRAIEHADENDIPLNSLEGFVRQIIGWREFIRGIYQRFSQKQDKANYFQHHRKMKPCWWTGETGLVPLDMAIKKALRFGWTHHIERLMVLSNCMNLCEIEPRQCHDWFMSMYVDSSDWVMGPNVYGMGLMSDGGVFATKPYICGSNYLFKMSDYPKPKKGDTLFELDEDGDGDGDAATWADVMDGLYWRFIDRHRDFFAGNYRMAMMTRSLDKMGGDKKRRLFAAAERFMERVTTA